MTANLTTDSWYNPSTGVGGPQDKTSSFTFNPALFYDWDFPTFLRRLYKRDELAAIKVDAVVDDSFAKGWSVEAGGLTPAQNEAVIDFNDKLGIRAAVTRAVKWARLFGGGAVFIGSTDETLDVPLTKGGQLLFAHAYERDELYPSRWYDDPLSPKFGRPSHYRLQPYSSAAGMTSALRAAHIHETRFLLFYGDETTKLDQVENLGWGSSVLLRAMTALRQFNSIYALGVSLFADANQNIYKLKGFADLALAGRGDAVEERIKLIDQFRSAVHALIIDADGEDFVRSQLSLSGMDGVYTQYKERLAAAFQMPLTRLLGVSPAGLNATGESDERNWHKQVLSEQEDILRPALERWMRVAFAAVNGPTGGITPDSFKVKFPPLRDVTPREQAEIDSINMQTDTGYKDAGVLDVPTIAKARFAAEPKRPVLDNDQIAKLQADVSLTAPAGTQTETWPDATEDGVNVDDEPAVDTDHARFLAEMNEHRIERCDHGKKSRCRICGIEAVRSVSRDATGAPVFTTWWRAIGSVGGNPNDGQPRSSQVQAG